MKVALDLGIAQLKKHSEELCGDSVETASSETATTIVLSDGLGSGVKANILSRLTTKTAITMLTRGADLEEVMETLAHTLPICKVRNLAYSTFNILEVFTTRGIARLAEYDTPEAFVGNGSSLKTIKRVKKDIGGKVIHESFFPLQEGDWIVMVSDGVLHAGMNGVWNMAWDWQRFSRFFTEEIPWSTDAGNCAGIIASHCNRLYGSCPADDASIVVVKARKPRRLHILIGPPANPVDDQRVVQQLMQVEGVRVVCGGSTGNMVGRVLGRKVRVDLKSNCDRVPPTGIIDGIDLVTEGVLTIAYSLELLRAGIPLKQIKSGNDGASRLAAFLLEADVLEFLVGTAVNSAQQGLESSSRLVIKQQVVNELVSLLQEKGKRVYVQYF